MCIAVPMRVISIEGESALAEIDGVRREASLALLDQEVTPGDFILVHAGFAISTVDRENARETLALMREMLASEEPG